MEDQKAFEVIEQTIGAPGQPNRLPSLKRKVDGFSRADVVSAFQHAFLMIGGVPRMALWANAHPDKFYPLYAKLLPSTSLHIGDNAQVIIQHAVPPGPLDEHPSPHPAEEQQS